MPPLHHTHTINAIKSISFACDLPSDSACHTPRAHEHYISGDSFSCEHVDDRACPLIIPGAGLYAPSQRIFPLSIYLSLHLCCSHLPNKLLRLLPLPESTRVRSVCNAMRRDRYRVLLPTILYKLLFALARVCIYFFLFANYSRHSPPWRIVDGAGASAGSKERKKKK